MPHCLRLQQLGAGGGFLLCKAAALEARTPGAGGLKGFLMKPGLGAEESPKKLLLISYFEQYFWCCEMLKGKGSAQPRHACLVLRGCEEQGLHLEAWRWQV